jgi:hypothetical protein
MSNCEYKFVLYSPPTIYSMQYIYIIYLLNKTIGIFFKSKGKFIFPVDLSSKILSWGWSSFLCFVVTINALCKLTYMPFLVHKQDYYKFPWRRPYLWHTRPLITSNWNSIYDSALGSAVHGPLPRSSRCSWNTHFRWGHRIACRIEK